MSKSPPTLAEIARTGSRLDLLIALRDYLADALDNTDSARDQSSLSKQLRECIEEIDDLSANDEEADPLADLVPEG